MCIFLYYYIKNVCSLFPDYSLQLNCFDTYNHILNFHWTFIKKLKLKLLAMFSYISVYSIRS